MTSSTLPTNSEQSTAWGLSIRCDDCHSVYGVQDDFLILFVGVHRHVRPSMETPGMFRKFISAGTGGSAFSPSETRTISAHGSYQLGTEHRLGSFDKLDDCNSVHGVQDDFWILLVGVSVGIFIPRWTPREYFENASQLELVVVRSAQARLGLRVHTEAGIRCSLAYQ